MNRSAPPWAARFQIIRKLGMGGLGVVYEADDAERQHKVALKKLRLSGSQALFSLKREFRVLSGLHHENLVQIHDLFVDDDEPFFSMELVEGTDIRSYCTASAVTQAAGSDATIVSEEMPLACDLTRLKRVLPQLCRGLEALHEAGLVHRDIKPGNVIVTPSEVVKILDFGLVVDVDSAPEDSLAGQAVGTIAYMSPEQAEAKGDVTSATDWYAVGVLLYELLTGRLPFEAVNLAQLREKQKQPAVPPAQLVPSVPSDLNALCRDLLRISPEERPLGQEVLERLRAAMPKSGILPSVVRPSATFIGRDAELSVLREAWSGLEDSGARAVLVRGPAGIGKSSLVREFLSRVNAEAAGLVVLSGRCYERETVSHRAMDAVIDELSRFWRRLAEIQAGAILPREAARLRHLFPVLGRVPAVAGEPEINTRESLEERRTRGYLALRETFQRLASRRRVVLVLDDLQWIDRESVHLLVDLLRQPDAPNLLLVLISRDYPLSDTPSLQDLVTALSSMLRKIDVGPLPIETCLSLAREAAGTAGEKRLESIAAESEGNPFLLAELARFVKLETQVATKSLKLEGLFGRRLSTLPASARRLLEIICVAADPIPMAVARQTAGLAPAEFGESERLLNSGHFIRSAGGMRENHLEPYHNRIREIVVGSLARARLAEVHRSLAVVLEASGTASHDLLARHWHGAGDYPRAIPHFRASASEALASTDFDGAAQRLRTVLELGGYSWAEAQNLWAQLGDALAFAGHPIEAAEAYERATNGADRRSLLEFRRRGMEQLLGGGYMSQGLLAANKLLTEVGLSLPGSRRATLLRLVLGQLSLELRGLKWTPRTESSIPTDALAKANIACTVGTTLSIVDTLRASSVLGTGLRLSLDLGEPAHVLKASATASCMASALGQRRRAQRLLGVADAALALHDAPISTAYVSAAREFKAFFLENDWAEAIDYGDRAVRSFREALIGRSWEKDACLLYRAFARYYHGDLPALIREVSEHVHSSARSGNRFLNVSLRTGLRVRHLLADDPSQAIHDLEDAIGAWLPASDSLQVQHWYALWGRCETALYTGGVATARKVMEKGRKALERSLLLRVVRLRCEFLHLVGRVHLATAATANGQEKTAAIKAAQESGKRLLRERIPMGELFGRLLMSGAAHAAGNQSVAAEMLSLAVSRLEQTGTLLFAAAAKRRLGQSLGGDEGRRQIEQADAWMKEQGVVRPDRMTAMLVPGWA